MVKPKSRLSTAFVALQEFDGKTKELLPLCNNGNSIENLTPVKFEELIEILLRALQSHLGHNEDSSINLIQEVLTLLEKAIKCSSEMSGKSAACLKSLAFLNNDNNLDEKTKSSVCKVNEVWLSKPDMPSVIGMDSNTLTHLLNLLSIEKPLIGDVKRLYTARNCFTPALLESQLPQLKKIVQIPTVMTSEHGQKFYGHITSQSENIFVTIIKMISLELSSCTKTVAVGYGKALMMAWHNASDFLKTTIQKQFQILMEEFLKLRRTSLELTKRGNNILHLVDVWNVAVRKKTNDGFAAMITGCYQPFLWKYLQSGLNFQRCNAADLFLKAFPLHVPGDPEAEVRLLIEQVQHMENALQDDCHIVRIIAVREVLNILSVYWSEFTSTQIHTLMTIITKVDACDMSSSEVRRTVWRGLESFVEHEQPYEYLKKMLPSLGQYINDVNQSVRIAFIRLLIAIRDKQDPEFKYTAIVRISALLHILKIENQGVGRYIVKLLLPSMYTSTMESPLWIQRFSVLISKYPHSYRNFFLFSNRSLPFEDAQKIMCELIIHLGSFVRHKLMDSENDDAENDSTVANKPPRGAKSAKRDTKADASTVNESTSQKQTVFDDPRIVVGTFDIINILWVLHEGNLNKPAGRAHHTKLVDAYVRFGQCFISYYKDTPIFDSVVSLSGNIPSCILVSNSITLPGYCMKTLKTLEVTGDGPPAKQNSANPMMVDALVKWGFGSKILEQVTLWLEDAFESVNVQPVARAMKKVKISETIKPNSLLAIRLLDEILGTEHTKQKILSKNYNELLDLWKLMGKILELLYRRFLRGSAYSDSLLSDEFLVACLNRYVKLIPLLSKTDDAAPDDDGNVDEEMEKPFDCQEEMMLVIEWAQDELLPLLHAEADNCPDLVMISRVMKHVLQVADNMITCHLLDHTVYSKIGELVISLLSCDYNLYFVEAGSRMAVAFSFAAKMREGATDDLNLNVWSVIVPSLFCLILNVLITRSQSNDAFDNFAEDFIGVKSNIGKILAAYEHNFEVRGPCKEGYRTVMLLVEKILSAVRSVLCREVPRSDMSVPVYSTLNALPTSAATILAPVYNKKFWTPMFLAVLKQFLSQTEKTLLIDILILHLFGKIEGKKWVQPVKLTMEAAFDRLRQLKQRRESGVRRTMGLTFSHVEPPRTELEEDGTTTAPSIPKIRIMGSDGVRTTMGSRDSAPSNMATVGTESRNSQPTVSQLNPSSQRESGSQNMDVDNLSQPSRESQPMSVDFTDSQPMSSQQSGSQPMSSQPLCSQPMSSQQFGSEPMSSQPLCSQPRSSQQTMTSSQPMSSHLATMGSSQMPIISQPVSRQPELANIPETDLNDDFICSAEELLNAVSEMLTSRTAVAAV